MLLSDPLFLLAAVGSIAVLAILMLGIGSFARGGAFNQRNANRIMRWRLGAQFLVVVLIVAVVYVRSRS